MFVSNSLLLTKKRNEISISIESIILKYEFTRFSSVCNQHQPKPLHSNDVYFGQLF